MKIIFLDIDGVLNSISGSVANYYLTKYKSSTQADGLSEESLGLLKFVVDMTGAKIVISSTWRSHGGPDLFKGIFESYGWRRPQILKHTEPSRSGEIRGDQINNWLTSINNEYESYVCIDDDSDYYPDQNLVHTPGVYGFQLYHALECIDILGLINVEENEKTISDLKLHVNFKRKNNE